VPTVKCANCKRPVKLNETVIFWKYEKVLIPEWKIHWRTLNTEKVKDNVIWQPTVWMRVCLECHKKLGTLNPHPLHSTSSLAALAFL
jgi:hypothetical protein